MTKRTKAIIGLTGVFILGGICGALLFGVIMRSRVREARDLRNREGFIRYFEKRLDLSQTQRDSLREELDRTYGELNRLREETAAQYNALIDTFAVHVMPVLTPEQRALFQTQERKFRRFMPRELHNRGPGGPRGRPMRRDSMRRTPEGAMSGSSATSSRSSALPPSATQGAAAELSAEALVRADTSDVGASADEGIYRRMSDQLPMLRKRLNLSDDQAARFQQIFAQAETHAKSIRTEYADQPSLRKRNLRDMLREMNGEIVEMLNEDQRAVWRSFRRKFAANRGWPNGRERSAGR